MRSARTRRRIEPARDELTLAPPQFGRVRGPVGRLRIFDLREAPLFEPQYAPAAEGPQTQELLVVVGAPAESGAVEPGRRREKLEVVARRQQAVGSAEGHAIGPYLLERHQHDIPDVRAEEFVDGVIE